MGVVMGVVAPGENKIYGRSIPAAVRSKA